MPHSLKLQLQKDVSNQLDRGLDPLYVGLEEPYVLITHQIPTDSVVVWTLALVWLLVGKELLDLVTDWDIKCL